MNKTGIVWAPPKELKPNLPLILTKMNNIYKNTIYLENFNLIILLIDNVILIYKLIFKASDLTFEFITKRCLDFISYDEELIYSIKNDQNEHSSFDLVIGTNKSNIYVLNISIKDYFIEILHELKLNNFNYEIFGFTRNKLIFSLDKELYILELIGNVRNFIMKVDENEKIISTNLKADCYLIVFTNMNVYMVDYAVDGRNQILIKLSTSCNYTSFIFNDKIYYIKESNTFAIFPIYDRENKFSIKLSAKNQINDLNFFKVLNVDDNFTIISNEKESEIYFISNKFKLIHKEHILFDKSFFVFLNNSIIVLSINLMSMSLKYKYCIFNNNQSELNKTVKHCESHSNINKVSLNEIEEEFVNYNSKRNTVLTKIKSQNLKIKRLLLKLSRVHELNYFCYLKEVIKGEINKILNLRLKTEMKNLNRNRIDLYYYKVFIIRCFDYKFGSRSLVINNTLIRDYFDKLLNSKIQELMQISMRINDTLTFSKLLSLIKTV